MNDRPNPVLEFRVAMDDWVAFAEHYATRSPRVRRIMNRQRWVGAVAIAFVLYLWAAWLDSVVYAIAGVLAGAVWWLWWPREFRRVIRKRTRQLYGEGRNADLQGPHRLTIEPDGLRVVTNASESLVRWAAIESVQTAPGYVFVMLGGSRGYAIPARTITGGNLDAFADELRRHVGEPAA